MTDAVAAAIAAEATSSEPVPAKLPWDLHPALAPERLLVCARLLAHARRDAIALASHELGDDPWSIGCRAYAFSRHRLCRTAESGRHPWLSILDESHHFVFLIEEVPVRFYRGAADDPTDRTMRRQEIEAQQLSLALGTGAEADGLLFRFAVETAADGRVERVVFLALRGEDRTECAWPVPLEAGAVPGDAAVAPSPSPVQLRLIAEDGQGTPPPGRNGAAALPPPRPRRGPRPPAARTGRTPAAAGATLL